jgi:hypothetical protein
VQSFGNIFSSCEVVKASGYAAFLSTEMEKVRGIMAPLEGRGATIHG